MPSSPPPPTVKLGAMGPAVSRVGLGAGGALRGRGREAEAARVLAAALAAGITLFDVGDADEAAKHHGACWAARGAARDQVALAGRTALRDGGGARRELEATLDRLDTDWLDVWQLHGLATMDDVEELLHPGGALDMLERAKAQGLVRAIGVVGARDPRVLLRAMAELPLDLVTIPLNPVEGALGGFSTEVLAAARAQGLGVLGNRVLGGGGALGGPGLLAQAGLDPARLLAYACAQPVDALLISAATPEAVAAAVAACHAPLDAAACRAFEAEVRPRAGQLATWRAALGGPC